MVQEEDKCFQKEADFFMYVNAPSYLAKKINEDLEKMDFKDTGLMK